ETGMVAAVWRIGDCSGEIELQGLPRRQVAGQTQVDVVGDEGAFLAIRTVPLVAAYPVAVDPQRVAAGETPVSQARYRGSDDKALQDEQQTGDTAASHRGTSRTMRSTYSAVPSRRWKPCCRSSHSAWARTVTDTRLRSTPSLRSCSSSWMPPMLSTRSRAVGGTSKLSAASSRSRSAKS